MDADASALSVAEQHALTVRLEFAEGICGGTIVSPVQIETARHCSVDGGKLLKVNGKDVVQVGVATFPLDMVRIAVGTVYTKWAVIGVAKQGDHVRWWGNPLGNADFYREGYVSAVSSKGQLAIVGMTCHGDSGSGIFNDKGELVGVISRVVSDENNSTGCFITITETP